MWFYREVNKEVRFLTISRLSAMFFHEYFADFDGYFGVFDESGTYNFVPNKRSPFSLFLSARGA